MAGKQGWVVDCSKLGGGVRGLLGEVAISRRVEIIGMDSCITIWY